MTHASASSLLARVGCEDTACHTHQWRNSTHVHPLPACNINNLPAPCFLLDAIESRSRPLSGLISPRDSMLLAQFHLELIIRICRSTICILHDTLRSSMFPSPFLSLTSMNLLISVMNRILPRSGTILICNRLVIPWRLEPFPI
jgi:hypothetical protein